MGFSDGSVGTESACNAGDTEDMGLIPGSERSLREGNGSLANSMDGRSLVSYSP